MIDPIDVTDLHPRRPFWQRLFTASLEAELAPPRVPYPERQVPPEGSYVAGRGPDLAVDFGTSAIVAALVSSDFTCEVLDFGGGPLLDAPLARRRAFRRSGLSENYELSSIPSFLKPGEEDSDWEYYPCLKRRIEWLARSHVDQEWQTSAVLDVAAVCYKALSQARDARGATLRERLKGAFQTYITVPNAFPRSAIDVLIRGVGYGVAAALGTRTIPKVRALLEAEAVAYGAIAAPTLVTRPGDTTVLVIDAGAGTTDASIVRSEKGVLRVLAHVGLPVGGMDLDAHAAALRGPFEGLDPFEIYQRLLTSREEKQRHLGEQDGVSPEEGFAKMAAELHKEYKWPAQNPSGVALKDTLRQGYERYLALAVDVLIRSLPADELRTVDQVVLSGRGSLLTGFKQRVRETLEHEGGPDVEPRCAESAHGRKLAVVVGVGTFVASTYSARWDRRPSRASFEIVLRHQGEQKLQLLPATHPLLEGWGVAAWYQPPFESGFDDTTRPAVDMRLIPRKVLEDLAREGSFSPEEIDQLLRWSILPLLRIERKAPYSARIAFDFLGLDVHLELNGKEAEISRQAVESRRLHPVHRLFEDWFEIFQRGKA